MPNPLREEYLALVQNDIDRIKKMKLSNPTVLSCTIEEAVQLTKIKKKLTKPVNRWYKPDYHKEYYQKNKEKILKQLKERHYCDICSGKYMSGTKAVHYR